MLSKRGEVDNKFETHVSHTLVQRGVFHQRHAEDASVMHPRAGGRANPSGAEPPPHQQSINIMVNIRGDPELLWGDPVGSAGDPRGIRMPLKGILAQKLLHMTHFLHTIRGIRVRPVTLIIILIRVN